MKPMKLTPVVTLAIYLLPASAWALPQFAVRSARTCNNCHAEPEGWHNPAVELRKCSLNCNTCHVNPTGGGMRSVSGRYYGREILPMFGSRPSDNPWTPSGDATSRPDSQVSTQVPPPKHEGRYGGLDPSPTFQIGADVRFMAYFPAEEGVDNSYFPMQTDLHLAARPINPEKFNEGRLTLLVTTGAEGSRSEEFSGFFDRFFVKEYMAIYDDLPYQAYIKAGRFLPAFGWRFDDHTSFVRQSQGFDNERQVTGIEAGINPNYLYAHVSVFNPATEWDDPFQWERGGGAAATFGYRELLWQAGASVMFETRDDATEFWGGANWGLNFHDATHDWKGLDWAPIIYLGELDVQNVAPRGGGDDTMSLTAVHELNALILRGLNIKVRYDWRDADLSFKDDHRHRVTAGVEFHPYTFVEVIAQYRINIEAGDRSISNNEALVQVHGWF